MSGTGDASLDLFAAFCFLFRALSVGIKVTVSSTSIIGDGVEVVAGLSDREESALPLLRDFSSSISIIFLPWGSSE